MIKEYFKNFNVFSEEEIDEFTQFFEVRTLSKNNSRATIP